MWGLNTICCLVPLGGENKLLSSCHFFQLYINVTGQFLFCSFGPRQIRAESCLLRPYNNATGAAPFESMMVADIGDIPINTYSLAATVEIIHKNIAAIVNHDCKPLVLGGDHTISYPILRGIKVSVPY